MGSLEKKRILLIGGDGYLGRHLSNSLLNENAQVYNVSMSCKSSDFDFNVDITHFERLKEVVELVNPDLIYHLAASLDRDRGLTNFKDVININLIGTSNVLRSMENIRCENIIFTSTSEVYGNRSILLSEDLSLNPVSSYSMSKVFSEMLLNVNYQLTRQNYTILRLFNIYGPDMPENFFIPQLINTLKKGQIFEMTSGEQYRDFIHIEDVVRAMIMCAKNSESNREILNICTGRHTQLRKLAEIVASQMGLNDCIKLGALSYRKNEVWHLVGDPRRSEQKIGFRARISIEDGIKTLVAGG